MIAQGLLIMAVALGVITGVEGALAAERCTPAKYEATGERASAEAECFADAAAEGRTLDAECLASAEARFSERFTRAERAGDCLTIGDAEAIGFRVDVFSGDVAELVSGSPGEAVVASDCDSQKIRAAGSWGAAAARCLAKAARSGGRADPDCVSRAEAKFGRALEAAERASDCNATDDEATLEREVLAFVTDVSAALEAVPCGTFLGGWGGAGTGDGQFDHPTGVAVDGRGKVYVADSRNHRIQKFTNGGNFLTQWGSFGGGDGQFRLPIGLRVDGSGNVFVAELNGHRVQKFTSSGTFLVKWGGRGSAAGRFNSPLGLGVDTSGNVFVADNGNNNRIQKFTNDGTFLTQWDSTGTGVVPFDPTDVAADESGDVYVTDQSNRHIQRFTNTGIFITQWGSFGSGEGQFDRAVGIVVDRNGSVLVGDRENNDIQKFTNTGTFLARWGVTGSGDGEFSTPLGVGVDTSGSIFVADGVEVFDDVSPNNNRIQKFACP